MTDISSLMPLPTLVKPVKAIPDSPYDLTHPWMGENVAPDEVLADIEMQRYHILVKQLGIRRKVGGLFLPDATVDAQRWTHGLVIVIKTGPGVYAGKRFEDMGISVEDAPKPGDVYSAESRISASRRMDLLGEEYFILPDDCLFLRVKRERAHLISFKL